MKEANVSEVAPVEVAPAEEQQALAISNGGAVGQALPPEQIKAPITAAQAKVDAVAALTMKAYERAGTLNLTKEETAQLQADFPDEAFKPGAAGKEHLIYIEHAFLRDRLNQVIGCGQWSIVPRSRWAEDFIIPARDRKPEVRGVRIYVEAMLIVRGCFVAENIGDMDYYPKNAGTNYGDAVRGATTQALRRCAADLGIGLQAWKKDWCEAWWKRRTGRGDPARQQFQRATPATPATTAKPASTQAAAKPPPQKGPPIPHAGNRMWLINKIGPAGRTAAEAYFHSIEPNPWLLPNEKLEDLCLRFVPATIPRAEALFQKIQLFAETGTAERPYEPDTRAQDGPPATTPAPATAKAEAKAQPDPNAKKLKAEEFWNVICPIPHKGEKRDEYMAHPDTIRSLYAATKAGDEAAQKRLWGFANNWAPEARTVNGKTYQPSAQDHLFREALDDFLDWHEKHGKDTEPQQKTLQDPPTGAIPEEDDDRLPF